MPATTHCWPTTGAAASHPVRHSQCPLLRDGGVRLGWDQTGVGSDWGGDWGRFARAGMVLDSTYAGLKPPTHVRSAIRQRRVITETVDRMQPNNADMFDCVRNCASPKGMGGCLAEMRQRSDSSQRAQRLVASEGRVRPPSPRPLRRKCSGRLRCTRLPPSCAMRSCQPTSGIT